MHLFYKNMSPSALKTVLESPPSDRSINEAHIATAIIHVIETARSQGQTLDDVVAELMNDDALLDPKSRHLLREIVTQAWNTI